MRVADTISTEQIFSLSSNELLIRLETSATGLTATEAASRLEIYGPNEIAKREQVSIIIEFLSHFKSPMSIILIICAIVSGAIKELTDAIIILSIVLVSVILDFTQEHRAEKAAEACGKG